MEHPKKCTCGGEGRTQDSRRCEGYIRRRYRCGICKARWTTAEFVVETGPGGARLFTGKIVESKLKALRAIKDILETQGAVLLGADLGPRPRDIGKP